MAYRRATFSSLALVIFLIMSLDVRAHGETEHVAPTFDRDLAFDDSRNAIGNMISDLRFRDRFGEETRLSSLRGKPLIVSLIYTSCPHFCPMITRAVAHATDIANDAVGSEKYNIVSVGFDTSVDTPARMASFARSHGIDIANWRFLSTDRESVNILARELGFSFAPSPNGFDHLAQTTLIDAEGVVFHQIYGTDFEAPFLVEPLKDLVFGRTSQLTSLDGIINRVRLFCTVYDPATGRYGFDYSLFIAAGIGALCLGGVGTVIARAWLHSKAPVNDA